MALQPRYVLKRIGRHTNEIVIDKEKTVFGRSRMECDIICQSVLVSRVHAEIHVIGDKLLLCDRNSSNGTYINNEYITPEQKFPLFNNDIISLGVTEYEEEDELDNYHLYRVILENCSEEVKDKNEENGNNNGGNGVMEVSVNYSNGESKSPAKLGEQKNHSKNDLKLSNGSRNGPDNFSGNKLLNKSLDPTKNKQPKVKEITITNSSKATFENGISKDKLLERDTTHHLPDVIELKKCNDTLSREGSRTRAKKNQEIKNKSKSSSPKLNPSVFLERMNEKDLRRCNSDKIKDLVKNSKSSVPLNDNEPGSKEVVVYRSKRKRDLSETLNKVSSKRRKKDGKSDIRNGDCSRKEAAVKDNVENVCITIDDDGDNCVNPGSVNKKSKARQEIFPCSDNQDDFFDENESRFENSDEEEFYCSQIFNCPDEEKDKENFEVANKEIKKEVSDEIIIIEDDSEDDDEIQSWYEKLSQSHLEDEEDSNDKGKEVMETSAYTNSGGRTESSNYVMKLNDNDDILEINKDENKEAKKSSSLDSVLSAQVKASEVSSKKPLRKTIYTEPKHLPVDNKVTKQKNKQSDSKSKQSRSVKVNVQESNLINDNELKKTFKESRREKLKDLALKSQDKNKTVTKRKIGVKDVSLKSTLQTRNDRLLADLVNETNIGMNQRTLRSNYRIPLNPTDANKKKVIDTNSPKDISDKNTLSFKDPILPVEPTKSVLGRSPGRSRKGVDGNVGKTECDLRNTTEAFGTLSIASEKPKSSPKNLKKSQKRVTFNLDKQVMKIDVPPGTKLYPLKKDAPIPRIVIDNKTVGRFTSLSQEFPMDETKYSILRWKVPWMEEFNNKSVPPNVSNNKNHPNGVMNVRESYPDFRSYFCVYQELLLHEVWNQTKEEFYNKARKLDAIPFKVDSQSARKVEYSVSNGGSEKHFLQLHCHRFITVMESQQANRAKASDLGILTISGRSKNKNKIHTKYTFCFIESSDVCKIPPHRLYGNNSHLDVQNMRQLRLTILIKELEPEYVMNTNIEVTLKVIHNIRSVLRQFSSLRYLENSPLCSAILNPSKHDFTINDLPVPIKKQPSMNKLNEAQRNAILNCTKLCLGTKPNIALIHGPPGTGKSHVIVHLIEHIFQMNQLKENRFKERPKILVCAPSNLAVDLLVERLLDLREELKANNKRLSIVREGQQTSGNARVASVTLDRLSHAKLREEYCGDRSLELSLVTAKINCYQRNNGTMNKSTQEKLEGLLRKKTELELIPPEEYNKRQQQTFDRSQLKDTEIKILRGADVICTTLNSSMRDNIKAAFCSRDENEPQLTCCIIDESSQACEPEILIPFQLNILKFVLVGDHKQLPATVTSEFSKNKGLGNSLFYRIYSLWDPLSKSPKSPSPIFSLNTQYRMHPSIVSWPCGYFYRNKLKTEYSKIANFPIVAYMTIHHYFSEDSTNKECNHGEAKLVISLAEAILKSCENIQIGIITPYRYQRAVLYEELRKRVSDPHQRERVKVNTIDGYQGTEQDIIIMSCVRSSNLGFLVDEQRLNVAVTRARHSLFICGYFDIFKSNQHWHSLLENASQRKKYCVLKKSDDEGIRDLISKVRVTKR